MNRSSPRWPRSKAKVVFGTQDDHFDDPRVEAETIASQLSGTMVMVEGTCQEPHVPQPVAVAEALPSLPRW